jgi:hypothetical protein
LIEGGAALLIAISMTETTTLMAHKFIAELPDKPVELLQLCTREILLLPRSL